MPAARPKQLRTAFKLLWHCFLALLWAIRRYPAPVSASMYMLCNTICSFSHSNEKQGSGHTPPIQGIVVTVSTRSVKLSCCQVLWYPFTPAMLILCSSFLIISCIWNDPLPSFGAILFLGASVPVFYLKRHLENQGKHVHSEIEPNSLTEEPVPLDDMDTQSDEDDIEDTPNVTTRHAEM